MDEVYDRIIQSNLNSPPSNILINRDAAVLQDLELHRRPILGISTIIIIISNDRSQESIHLAELVTKIIFERYGFLCKDLLEERIIYEMGSRYRIPYENHEHTEFLNMHASFVQYLYGTMNLKIPTVLNIRPR